MRRELFAAGSLLALAGAGMLRAIPEGERVEAADIPRRDYDLQGPKPNAGPPTAVEANVPSRQQRRWLERQAAKNRS